jgi:beta-glucanase (GH16 family)
VLHRKVLAVSVACGLALCAVSALAQDAPKPIRDLGGYQLVFHDDFDSLDISPAGIGSNTWHEGVWFNHKHPPASHITVSNGVLTLTWTPNQGCPDTSIATLSHDAKNFHAWRYGYFEGRMKWDVVRGSWPAFWLIPVQSAKRTDIFNGIHESGEIDIFEGQGDHPHQLYTTVHDWTNNTHDSANKNNTVQLPSDIDLNKWHVYGLLWTAGQLTWYLDNKPIHSEPTPAVFDRQDYYIVLSSQESVNWKEGDMTGVTASKIDLNVDWVRVWQQQQ